MEDYPTIDQIRQLVDFKLIDGKWIVGSVLGNVEGNVLGSVWGDVRGDVNGDVGGSINGKSYKLFP
jgi:hypothetical protein